MFDSNLNYIFNILLNFYQVEFFFIPLYSFFARYDIKYSYQI